MQKDLGNNQNQPVQTDAVTDLSNVNVARSSNLPEPIAVITSNAKLETVRPEIQNLLEGLQLAA